MAAHEMFEAFAATLTSRDRDLLGELIAMRRNDMLAARSEEARLRIAEQTIRDARALLGAQKK